MGYLQTSARENHHWINAVLEVSQVNHCNEFWKEALVRRLGVGREATLGSTSPIFGMNNWSVIITTIVTCHCSPEGTSGILLTLKGTEMDKTSTVTYVLSPGCNLWMCDTTLQPNCPKESERAGGLQQNCTATGDSHSDAIPQVMCSEQLVHEQRSTATCREVGKINK